MIAMCFFFYLLARRVFQGHSLDDAFVRLMSGMSGFVILCCILMGIVSVFLTHRVAGASYRLEKCIRGLTEGNLDLRIALRTKDYLQNLAEALNELRAAMRTQADQKTSVLMKLEAMREALDKAGKLDDATRVPVDEILGILKAPPPQPSAPSDKENAPAA